VEAPVRQWARHYAALDEAATPAHVAFGRRASDRLLVVSAEVPPVLQERLARRFLMQYAAYQLRIHDTIASVGPLGGPLHRVGAIRGLGDPAVVPRRVLGFARHIAGATWERWHVWDDALQMWQPDAVWWSPLRLWRDGPQWWALDSWVGLEQSAPPAVLQDFWSDLTAVGVLVLVVAVYWPADWALDAWTAFDHIVRYPAAQDQLSVGIWPGGRAAQSVQLSPGWHPAALVDRLDTGRRLGLWERLHTRPDL